MGPETGGGKFTQELKAVLWEVERERVRRPEWSGYDITHSRNA